MDFSLDGFVTSPSWAKIEKCKKKADLLMLANCYNVHVLAGTVPRKQS